MSEILMCKMSRFDTLVQCVDTFLTHHDLIQPNQAVIIGFSGGPDSLFLVHALVRLQKKYNLTLIAAHLDHGWRDTSQADLLFCKKVAAELNLTFVHEHAQNIQVPKQTKRSQEELGRLQRRVFFEKTQQKRHGSVIALGHHADDQKETFFIRLLRGAGVTGLAGIKPRDGDYIHPLLCCTKQEIIDALESANITYLTDPTNRSDQFLRNRIRASVIPALQECDERFDRSLQRTMERLREADDFISTHAANVFEGISCQKNNQTWVDSTHLLMQHPYLQKQILVHWFVQASVPFTPSTALFSEVLRFLHNKKSNQHTLYQSWCILKKGDYATITFCS